MHGISRTTAPGLVLALTLGLAACGDSPVQPPLRPDGPSSIIGGDDGAPSRPGDTNAIPTVTAFSGPSTSWLDPGDAASHCFTVKNNATASVQMSYAVPSNSAYTVTSVPATETYAGLQSRTRCVSVRVKDDALYGQSFRIRLTATSTNGGMSFSDDDASPTTFRVRRVVRPLGIEFELDDGAYVHDGSAVPFTIHNNSNFTESVTLTYRDIPLDPNGDVIYRLDGPAYTTVPAYGSTTVDIIVRTQGPGVVHGELIQVTADGAYAPVETEYLRVNAY